MHKLQLPDIKMLDTLVLKKAKDFKEKEKIIKELKENSTSTISVIYNNKKFRGKLMKCTNKGYYSSIVLSDGEIRMQVFIFSPKLTSLMIGNDLIWQQ